MMSAEFVSSILMNEYNRLQANNYGPGQDRVRKSLFGPVDHEESKKFLQEELAKISRQDSERWNFDFESETPLFGRFDWKLEESPFVYECSGRLPYLKDHSSCDVRVEVEEEARVVPDPTDLLTCDSHRGVSASAINNKSPRIESTAQSRITDFLRARKRPSSTATSTSSPNKKLFCPLTSPTSPSRKLLCSSTSPTSANTTKSFCPITSSASDKKLFSSVTSPTSSL